MRSSCYSMKSESLNSPMNSSGAKKFCTRKAARAASEAVAPRMCFVRRSASLRGYRFLRQELSKPEWLPGLMTKKSVALYWLLAVTRRSIIPCRRAHHSSADRMVPSSLRAIWSRALANRRLPKSRRSSSNWPRKARSAGVSTSICGVGKSAASGSSSTIAMARFMVVLLVVSNGARSDSI